MSTPPLYDPADASRSAVALVNHHLTWLKLGGLYLDFSKTPRDIPEGRGWCRAEALPEVLWPAHAELAVGVHFFPDPLFRRNDRTGQIPPGAMQHWTERLDACADALADCGFVVEEWGIPKTPVLHSGADLVVYRLPAGKPPSPRTAKDLRHAHPPRPNFKTRQSADTWPIEALLERADPPLFSRHERQDKTAPSSHGNRPRPTSAPPTSRRRPVRTRTGCKASPTSPVPSPTRGTRSDAANAPHIQRPTATTPSSSTARSPRAPPRLAPPD